MNSQNPAGSPRFRKPLTDQFWSIFVSVRLTITLLVCLTLFSIAGTLIAQQGTTQVPLEKLYKLETLKWLVAFGLTDIYHSAPFIFFLLLLALNLVACSIERLPKVWREAFHVDPPPVSDPTLKEMSAFEAKRRKFLLVRAGRGKKGHEFESVREAKAAAMLFMERQFGHFMVLRDQADQFQLSVEKGKYSRLGVYVTHLSLLLIMFGAATGAIVGFEGGMSIEEGTRQSWMQHIKGSKGGMQTMRENGVPVPGFLNLGFEVECERFALETYDGERPKAFKSLLNFYENDVKVHSAEIAVNHPTVYKGITFYQASYQDVGIGSASLKVFRVAGRSKRSPSSVKPTTGGAVSAVKLPPVDSGKAPSLMPAQAQMPKIESVELVERVRVGDLYRVDGDAAFRLVQLEPNLMDLGPAAKVQFYPTRETKKPAEFWVFKNLPGFDFAHRQDAKLNFVLEGISPKFATGLSIARDPGVWVVWIGSAIMILALFMALYTCHSRYWLAYTKEDGFVLVGWSNKLFLFEPRFEKFEKAYNDAFIKDTIV